MIFVIFENNQTDSPDPNALRLGPYLVAQIEGDHLLVMDRHQPVKLAFREGDLWRVNDGMSDQGPSYRSVRFVSKAHDRLTGRDREHTVEENEPS